MIAGDGEAARHCGIRRRGEEGTRRARRIGIPLPPPPIIQLRRRPRLSPPPLASVASPGNKLYGKLWPERYYDVVLGPANISIPLEEGARTRREEEEEAGRRGVGEL